jgi:hypothetical protein
MSPLSLTPVTSFFTYLNGHPPIGFLDLLRARLGVYSQHIIVRGVKRTGIRAQSS